MTIRLVLAVILGASLLSACDDSEPAAPQALASAEFRERLASVCDDFAVRYDDLFEGITDRSTQQLVELQEDLVDLGQQLVEELGEFAPEEERGRWEGALADLEDALAAAEEQSPPNVDDPAIGVARRQIADRYEAEDCFP